MDSQLTTYYLCLNEFSYEYFVLFQFVNQLTRITSNFRGFYELFTDNFVTFLQRLPALTTCSKSPSLETIFSVGAMSAPRTSVSVGRIFQFVH